MIEITSAGNVSGCAGVQHHLDLQPGSNSELRQAQQVAYLAVVGGVL